MQGDELLYVGLDGHLVPLELLERYNLPIKVQEELLRGVAQERGPIRELVILGTCHRLELYAVGEGITPCQLAEALHHPPIRQIQHPFRLLRNLEAVQHLFQVSAGLNSPVLGESEILGQVREAYKRARALGTVGPYLSRAFEQALQVGKEVRHQTQLGSGPTSLGALAARILNRYAEINPFRVIVLGAGQIATSAALALDPRFQIVVINRSPERGEALAQRVGGQYAPLELLPELLPSAQALIAAVSAPHPVVQAEWLRPGSWVIDLGLPRNVEAVPPGVTLYTLDRLQDLARKLLAEREGARQEAEALVAHHLQRFAEWLASRQATPHIRALREGAWNLLLEEVKRLPPPEQEAALRAGRRTLNKLLHAPTLRLRKGDPEALSWISEFFPELP